MNKSKNGNSENYFKDQVKNQMIKIQKENLYTDLNLSDSVNKDMYDKFGFSANEGLRDILVKDHKIENVMKEFKDINDLKDSSKGLRYLEN